MHICTFFEFITICVFFQNQSTTTQSLFPESVSHQAGRSNATQPNSLDPTVNRSHPGASSSENRSLNRSPSPTAPFISSEDDNSRFDPPSSHEHEVPEAPPPSYQDVMKGGYKLPQGNDNLDMP